MAPFSRFSGLRAALALGTACAVAAPPAHGGEPETQLSAATRLEQSARARCDGGAPADACASAYLDAAREYRRAGAFAKAIRIARLGLGQLGAAVATRSALAKELADGYAGLGVFDRAADAFAFALEGASGPVERGDVLLDALPLLFALGKEVEAERLVADFTKQFPDAKASGTLTLGVVHRAVDQARWGDALAAGKGALDRGYPPDVSVRLAVLAARATRAIHKDERHVPLAQVALRLAGDPSTLTPRLRSAWPDEDEAHQDRRLAQTLTAIGEAHFLVAEAQQRAEVDALRIPAFGGGTSLEAFASTTLRPWVEKKRAAIESVSRAYAAVLDVHPAPPPRWVIAAGRNVGLMWAGFVDELDGLGARHKAVKDFRDAVRGLTEPYRSGRAQPAMRACVSYATKFQWIEPGVRDCERWLAKNYPGTLVPVDELVPRLVAVRSLPLAPPLPPAAP
jgi:tetratricopeptide (TPR) repeat protein